MCTFDLLRACISDVIPPGLQTAWKTLVDYTSLSSMIMNKLFKNRFELYDDLVPSASPALMQTVF